MVELVDREAASQRDFVDNEGNRMSHVRGNERSSLVVSADEIVALEPIKAPGVVERALAFAIGFNLMAAVGQII